MKRLLDLRFVIGVFFLVVGILLLVHGLTVPDGADVNRWCGIIFSVFGILMIILSLQKHTYDEVIENANTELLGDFLEESK